MVIFARLEMATRVLGGSCVLIESCVICLRICVFLCFERKLCYMFEDLCAFEVAWTAFGLCVCV